MGSICEWAESEWTGNAHTTQLDAYSYAHIHIPLSLHKWKYIGHSILYLVLLCIADSAKEFQSGYKYLHFRQ